MGGWEGGGADRVFELQIGHVVRLRVCRVDAVVPGLAPVRGRRAPRDGRRNVFGRAARARLRSRRLSRARAPGEPAAGEPAAAPALRAPMLRARPASVRCSRAEGGAVPARPGLLL